MAKVEEARQSARLKERSPTFGERIVKFEPWLFLVFLAAFLLIWEWQARLGNVSPLFFPAPSVTVNKFLDMLRNEGLLLDFSTTVTRMLTGFFFGGGVGFLLGILMGWFAHLRRIVDPLIAVIHPVPKITFLPIVLILFGLGEDSRIILIGLSAFFPMVISCMAAVLQINPVYFEVAQNYGASSWAIFRRVVWPGSLAGILTGIRLSLVRALGATIVIEIRYATQGLGYVIWTSWETLRTTHLYSVVILIALMGFGINSSLLRLRAVLAPWHTGSRS